MGESPDGGFPAFLFKCRISYVIKLRKKSHRIMAKQKRQQPQAIKRNEQEVHVVETAVLNLVEEKLDGQFDVVSVDFEREAGSWYIRIYVEQPKDANSTEGITLQQCHEVSQLIDEDVDALSETLPELAKVPYYMEVSSPGLFRELKKEREFNYYLGEAVKVMPSGKKNTTYTPVEGTLDAYDSNAHAVTVSGKSIALDKTLSVFLNPVIKQVDETSR